MNSRSSFKERKQLIILLTIVLTLLSGTSFFMERALRTASNNAYQLENLYEISTRLQTIRLLFSEKRNYITSLSSHSYDEVQHETLKNQISESIDSFNMNLNDYVGYVNDFPMNDQELARVRNLENLSAQYNGLILEIVVAAGANDTEAVEMLLTETEPLVQHLNAFFDEMQNYTQAVFYETLFSIDRNISHTTTIVVIVFAVVIITLLGVILHRSIKISENSLPERNEPAPHISKEEADLLTEMRKCVSDLKAVAYDLGKSTEDIKK